jgi:hypothetical protein
VNRSTERGLGPIIGGVVALIALGVGALFFVGRGDGDAVATDSSTSTSVGAPTTTTSVTSSTSQLPPFDGTTTTMAADRATEAEVVGSPIDDRGTQFVRWVDPSDDVQCRQGLLGLDRNGETVHRYDELGPVGTLDLRFGPFGELAFVETCEESPVALFFAAGTEPGQIPELVESPVDAEMFALGDLGWLGSTGWFAAMVTFYDNEVGWNDLVVWDPTDGSSQLWADVFGSRDDLAGEGLDFVVPNGWNYAPIAEGQTTVNMWDQESETGLNITVHVGGVADPELGPGETALGTADVVLPIWSDVGDGRSQHSAFVDATDHLFVTDAGSRTVRVVVVDGRTIVMELTVSDDLGTAVADVPRLALDAVRIFDAVG